MANGFTSAIESKPEHARELGIISAEWNLLEHFLCLLLGQILRIPLDAAIAIIYSVHSNKIRRDIILNSAKVMLRDNPSALKDVERILKRVAKAAKKRNDLAHTMWGAGSQLETLTQLGFTGSGLTPGQQVSVARLKRTKQQIREIIKDLRSFLFP